MDDKAIVAALADELPVGIWVARAPGGEFVYANKRFADIMGVGARDDVAIGEYAQPYQIHKPTGELYPEDQMPFVRALRARETITVDDIVIHRPDGKRAHIRAFARPVFADAEITHVVIAFFDITREAEAEERLQRAQRMESIGNLAGGIAHDFNNLLAAIRMLASALRLREVDPAKRADLEKIDQVTESAGQLTRALLGFAGRGKHRAARFSVNRAVDTITDLVKRTFDREINIRTEALAKTGDVVGDYAQLEQVVMNLIVNARDAVTAGTALTPRRIDVRSRDVLLTDAEAHERPPLQAGAHVALEVADTGTGIDPEIRDRIFEPYFTTKTSGEVRGTGLGLATVYGIVQAHKGHIEVLPNQPHGTIMRVLLPAAPPGEAAVVGTRAPGAAVRGRGTILLVEDDANIRSAARFALEGLGYDVLTAADGVEAVELFSRRPQDVDVVVLDMVMPRLGGRATYLAMRAARPDVRVVLTTGYALNDEAQEILNLGVREFLPKPYSVEDLSHIISTVCA